MWVLYAALFIITECFESILQCNIQGCKMIKVSPFNCGSGWIQRDFGNKKKCYKLIGKYRIEDARQKCAELEAAVPLPRNDMEQSDLIRTSEYFGLKRK